MKKILFLCYIIHPYQLSVNLKTPSHNIHSHYELQRKSILGCIQKRFFYQLLICCHYYIFTYYTSFHRVCCEEPPSSYSHSVHKRWSRIQWWRPGRAGGVGRKWRAEMRLQTRSRQLMRTLSTFPYTFFISQQGYLLLFYETIT